MEIAEIATKQQIEELMDKLHSMSRAIEQLGQLLKAQGYQPTTPNSPHAVYSRGTAAKLLGISRATLDRRIADGAIRTNGYNKVPASEIDRFASVHENQYAQQINRHVPPAFRQAFNS